MLRPKDPENRAEISTSGESFSWEDLSVASVYLVEFSEQDSDTPFFSAYTKKSVYNLPAIILNLKFSPDKDYTWHVRGFNKENVLTGESPDRSFLLSQ